MLNIGYVIASKPVILKKILVKGTLFKQSSTTDIANIKDKKRRTYRDDNYKVPSEFA
jgi:hypothetical protein